MTPPPAEPRTLLFASDIDGTLLTPDHRITPATADAVAAARAAGVTVVLASARSPRALALLQEPLGLLGQPMVAFQGAWVGRWADGSQRQVLAEHRIAPADALAVLAACEAAGTPMIWYTADDSWYSRLAPVVEFEAKVTRIPLSGQIDPEAAAADGGPHKIMVPPNEDRPGAVAEVVAALPPGLVAHVTGENYVEVTAAGADKSHGLADVAAALKIPHAQVAAAGDGPNDTGMLVLAGRSFAMGNAAPEVQAAADHVTGTNTEDGLAAAIRACLD